MKIVTLLALLLAASACSSSGDDSPVGAGGTGDGGSSGNGGAAGALGGGTGGLASDCPPWPAAKLFPWIGPFFYGSNPGPCTHVQIQPSGGSTKTYQFSYDASGTLQEEATTNGSDRFSFTSSEGLLTGATYTYVGGQSAFSYQYDSSSVTFTQTTESGTTVATYFLDSLGYPQHAQQTGQGAENGGPASWTYHYQDCRIQQRLIYDSSGAELTDYASTYSYDAQGNLIEILSEVWEDTFEYSCW